MENKKGKTNECPVCEQATKEDYHTIYCDICGFNIKKQEQHTKQKAV